MADKNSKLGAGYAGVQGGLFSKVTKADVGDAFAQMAGDKVILMGWADPFYPDPSIPDVVKQTMLEAFTDGFASHYTMPIGSLELRTEIAKKVKAYNHLDVDPRRNIIVTPGSDSALFFAMHIFMNPGDEVLVPDPSYPSNFLNPKLMGGTAVPVPLKAEDNYRFDIAAFEKAVTPKTKMVLITHPNNPTATVFRKENLEELAKFVIRHDLILVSDQAFEDIVFDGIEFVTPASLPGMWERTITVCSISKGMGLSGFRVGYIVACDAYMDVYYGAAVNVLGATNTASQLGAITAFQNPGFMQKYKQHYDRRRKDAVEILGKVPGVSIEMPESGFFCWVNVSKLGDSAEITEYLAKHAKVAVNDGVNYGAQGKGYLRIINGCLGSDEESRQALERIAAALVRYAGENGK
ncbi:MAG: pyridoxal phosphate-dependent aminotransferase [Christensenellaceae bacterium]|jgi:aspartate/methionine/tyrosine aminotransferase|nr:pyridoxal phosphate-dependent aminotransferase [Christensenellaceae bacterium]